MKQKILAILIGVIFSLFGFFGLDNFYDQYDFIFQSPIVIKTQAPIIIKSRQEKILTPLAQAQEIKKEVKQEKKQEPEKRKVLGQASFYSWDGCLGCNAERRMANGDILDDAALTVALPPNLVNKYKLLNDLISIKNVDNNKEIIAKVTDTGGFYELTDGKRVADLSVASKNALDCKGLCTVELSF